MRKFCYSYDKLPACSGMQPKTVGGIKGCSVKVCNRCVWMKTGGARDRKKESEWCNEKARSAVLQAIKVFEQWQQ